ncbi:MAG: hypothetical protein OEL66_08120, partial [Desulfobulbaceae bacterium]|nr:hypothetical protein [Desulfobulbaceae bacterium]
TGSFCFLSRRGNYLMLQVVDLVLSVLLIIWREIPAALFFFAIKNCYTQPSVISQRIYAIIK